MTAPYRIFTLAAAFCGVSVAAFAECAEPYELLFGCDIPERGARVEMCRIFDDKDPNLPPYQYTYSVDDIEELSFTTSSAMSTVGTDIKGVSWTSLTTGFQNGDTVYAAYISDESPYPLNAVVLVYKNLDDYTHDKQGKILARRHCYPPSIRVNMEWFGPG